LKKYPKLGNKILVGGVLVFAERKPLFPQFISLLAIQSRAVVLKLKIEFLTIIRTPELTEFGKQCASDAKTKNTNRFQNMVAQVYLFAIVGTIPLRLSFPIWGNAHRERR
jgi:hypothetical protein